MVDRPLSCNHRMVGLNHGYTGGNLAVNLVGGNLGDPAQGTSSRFVRYEMIRGSSDFIRACDPEVTYGEMVLRQRSPILFTTISLVMRRNP